jgi:hypothetical protein
MPKSIQIRDVSDSTHATLSARARRAGLSLSAYLKREADEMAARPSLDEWYAEIRSAPRTNVEIDFAELIRKDRDSH